MLMYLHLNLIIFGWVCPATFCKSPPTSDTLKGLDPGQGDGRTSLPGRPAGPPLTDDDDLTLAHRRAQATAPPPAAPNRTVMHFVREPHSQLVANGARAEMTCQVSVSGVTIQWLRAGKPVETNRRKIVRAEDGALVITKVRRNKGDDGTYQCKVLSDAGAMLSQPAKLTIASIKRNFSVWPSDQSAPAGGVAVLRCVIDSVPPARIEWMRDGESLPVNSSERLSADVAGQLSIRPVTAEDAGVYSCVAYNDIASRQRRSDSGTLTVTAPETESRAPRLMGPPPPEHSAVRANYSLVLPCVADGHPLPSVRWTRDDGLPVPSSAVTSGGSLNLTTAQLADAATYTCTATNAAGQASRRTTVEVLVPPVITSELPALKELRRGWMLRMHCTAEGWPPPNLSWIKDGHRLTPDATGRVRLDDGKLSVANLQSADSGIYQCVAYSKAGYTAVAVHLITGSASPSKQVDPPSQLKVSEITSRTARLTWSVDDDAEHLAYTIHIRDLGGVTPESQQVVAEMTHMVRDLRPYTNYSVYVRAYSTDMASDPSETIEFRTAEDVPSETPRVTLVAVSPTELNVSWEALPASLSNGVITGYRINSQRHNDPATASMVEVGADRHSFLITGLEPGRAYDVRVLAATRVGYQNVTRGGGAGELAQWVQQRMPERSLTPVDPGPRPPAVHLVVSNHTTILISWEMPDSADRLQAPPVGFNVLYRRQDLSSELKGPIRLPADTYQYYLTDLVPNTWYEVHVQTVAADWRTAEAIKTISTLPVEVGGEFELERPVLEPPVALNAEALNATAVLFKWQRPPSARAIQYYTVKYRPINSDKGQPVLLSSTDSEMTVTRLQPFTLYEFTVRSHDADNTYGPYSEGKRVRTLEGAPSPPLNVSWFPVDASRIRVSWRPPLRPHGQIAGYRVFYTHDKDEPLERWSYLDIPASSGTNMQLSQLVPNQQYWLRVRGRTAAAPGQLSDMVRFEIRAVLQSSTPTPAPASHGTTYTILTGVLLLVVLLAGTALGLFCHRRRRRRGRQRSSAGAASRPHLNGAAGSGSGAAGAAAGSDHVEMEVLTPMLTHVAPAAEHQLDTKGGHPTTKPANGRANGFVHPLYLSTDRLRRGSGDAHNESRVGLINNNSSVLSSGSGTAGGGEPPPRGRFEMAH
ncbi:protogenin-like [Amphibalanus amphitrite]|uniref:protogenin-like n=1 Tax=Amphibalanus amphitrite TaxID=1232801 RepID=UPI001C912E31|nr:protogenin-like [Amphibalanus amphitrite]